MILGGINNTAVGAQSGASITDGNSNTLIGFDAGSSVTTKIRNVIIGSSAYANGDGDRNIIIGHLAGSALTGAEANNIFIGDGVTGTLGESSVLRIGQGTGSGNSLINEAFIHGIYGKTPAGGSQRLVIMDSNSQLGTTAGGSFTTNSFATDSGSATPAAGVITMAGGSNLNTSGSGSTVTYNLDDDVTISGDFTSTAGNLNLPDPNAGGTQGVITVNSERVFTYLGAGSIGLGNNAMNLAESGGLNIAIGTNSLGSITSGNSNVSIGINSQPSQISGIQNVSLGRNALFAITDGDYNVSIGSDSLQDLNGSSASYNTAVGNDALDSITTGAYNSALGYDAGTSATGASSSNIYIRNAGAVESNTIRIGTQGTGNGQQDTTFIAGIYNTTPSGGNDGMVIIDSAGQLGSQVNFVMPENPAFLANTAPNTQNNVTGDGTAYTVIFTDEKFDQGSDFDGTSTFTAPVTGRYHLIFACFLEDIAAGHTGMNSSINTSNNTYVGSFYNPAAMANGTNFSIIQAVIADMDASDTATCTVTVQNSTKVVNVDTGGVTQPRSYFCGSLVS